jgi:hypothetical protein
MKIILCIILLLINMDVYAQDEYYDYGMAEELIIQGEKEYDAESVEAHVLNQINGTVSDRKRFIETELLEDAGFRRTGDVKYRKTNAEEKTFSALQGLVHLFSLGLVPMKPFFEVEYDRLPQGDHYKFESVILKNALINAAPEVLTIIELEYMLQVEFCYGIVLQDNVKYYTDENIKKFENLISKLPDYPESVKKAKTRYSNDLRSIKAALERYNNPSENYLRALQNLGKSFK